MKTLSKDARGFVDSVAGYIRSDKRGKQLLPRVQSLFTKVTASARKERLARVETAVTLTAAEKNSVTRILGQILDHDVDCTFVVDREVIGGLKIQVADWVIDTSLVSELGALGKTLI